MIVGGIPTIHGTDYYTPYEVRHLLVPGRYRSPDGMDLSDFSMARVRYAAQFFVKHDLMDQEGVIICSGYKSPKEHAAAWHDDTGREFEGRPEAYSMKSHLVDLGIPEDRVLTETDSIDTVTNFTNSVGLLPDKRTVGIVAQAAHLKRMMRHIAPKTLDMPHVGLIVPEIEGNVDLDPLVAVLVTKWIARGLTASSSPDQRRANARLAHERANNVWQTIQKATRLARTAKKSVHLLTQHHEMPEDWPSAA